MRSLHYHYVCQRPGCDDEVIVDEPTVTILWLDFHVYPIARACVKVKCLERKDENEN